MKTKRIFRIALAGLTAMNLLKLSAFAQTPAGEGGIDVGNGGGGYVCQETNGSIRWVELIDLWEARRELRLDTPDAPGLSEQQYLRRAFEAMRRASHRERPSDFTGTNWFSNPWTIHQYGFALRLIESNWTLVREAAHPLTSDVLASSLPTNDDCPNGILRPKQIVIARPDGQFIVDEVLYEALTPRSKAALKLHEAIYLTASTFARVTDSRQTRRLVGHIIHNSARLGDELHRDEAILRAGILSHIQAGTYATGNPGLPICRLSFQRFGDGVRAHLTDGCSSLNEDSFPYARSYFFNRGHIGYIVNYNYGINRSPFGEYGIVPWLDIQLAPEGQGIPLNIRLDINGSINLLVQRRYTNRYQQLHETISVPLVRQ